MKRIDETALIEALKASIQDPRRMEELLRRFEAGEFDEPAPEPTEPA